ncbi:MAG TPA: MFS transporter [Symbiobacteriaceae bacterium]|nr:MFS transporter [Symbiobacteriaceae bacterium]
MRVPRNVWYAGLVSLFTDISSEMLVPVLPLFLANVLGAPVRAIGLIEGLAEAMASLMKAFSGWLSDRTGRRKPLMVAGYSLSNFLKPLLGFTGGWGQVLAIKLADRFGKGLRGAPRDALIADSTPVEGRGRAFGFHRAMDTVGAAVGPLLAALILWVGPGQYRWVFWAAIVPGLLALVAIVFIRETGPGEKKAGPVLRNWSLSLGALPPRLRRFMVIGMLFAIGNSSDAFLILRAQNLGLAAALVPLAYFAFNASYAILSYPAGALSDKIGRKPVIVGGFAAFAVIYLGFAMATRAWMAWPLFLFYGLYYAGTEGVQKAYITDHADREHRGTAIGVYNALTGLAALPASLIAGYLWDVVGAAAPFYVGSVTGILAALLLLVWG